MTLSGRFGCEQSWRIENCQVYGRKSVLSVKLVDGVIMSAPFPRVLLLLLLETTFIPAPHISRAQNIHHTHHTCMTCSTHITHQSPHTHHTHASHTTHISYTSHAIITHSTHITHHTYCTCATHARHTRAPHTRHALANLSCQ